MLPKSKSLLIIAFVISALVLIGAAFLNHAALGLLTDARNQTGHSKDTLNALDATVTTLLDAETGQRGYLLTGREAYLRPYAEATQEVNSRLDALGRLTAGEADVERNLAELRSGAQEKLEELAETIRLSDAGDRQAALRLVMTDAGKHSMDQIRVVTERMKRSEQERTQQALAHEERARKLTAATGWITAALAIALLGLLAFIVKRDTAQIRASEMQLAITLRSIGDAVIATDGAGGITLMNPVAEQLTGFRRWIIDGRLSGAGGRPARHTAEGGAASGRPGRAARRRRLRRQRCASRPARGADGLDGRIGSRRE